MKHFARVMLPLAAAAVFATVVSPPAGADMCSPSNIPGPSYLWPKVKTCQLYVPGAGSLAPNIPVVDPAAPDPNYVFLWGSYVPIPRPLRGLPRP